MKNVEIGPIRPPSESNSLLVRVTRGCHWNKCYFCGLYKSIQFSMRPIEETIEDIAKQAQLYKGRTFTSCFLQDGDALVLKGDYLLRILDALNHHFVSSLRTFTYNSLFFFLSIQQFSINALAASIFPNPQTEIYI